MLIELFEDDLTLETAPSFPVKRGARAVIFDEGKVCLLYVKHKDFYTLPGGGIEADESAHEAVIREVLEETGYKALEALQTVIIREYFHNSRWEHTIFKVKVDKNARERTLTNEEISLGLEVVWKPLEEALDLFAHYESEAEMSQTIHQREFIALMNSI